LRCQRLPSVGLAHDDLAGSKQRPKKHGGSIRRRQRRLGLDASFELLISTFNGVGRPRALPLARWKPREGEQAVPGFFKAVGNRAVPYPPFAQNALRCFSISSGVFA
jgi:hypothetical protein